MSPRPHRFSGRCPRASGASMASGGPFVVEYDWSMGRLAQTGKAPSIFAAWSFRSARSQWP